MGVFLLKIIMYEERKLSNFRYSSRMAMVLKGSITTLLALNFCERINYVAAMTITRDNSFLGIAEFNMFIVLRINEKFLEFMRIYYRK